MYYPFFTDATRVSRRSSYGTPYFFARITSAAGGSRFPSNCSCIILFISATTSVSGTPLCLHDPADQFLSRIVCLEDCRGGPKPIGIVTVAGSKRIVKTPFSSRRSPASSARLEQNGRLVCAHPFSVERVIVDELVPAHPGLSGMSERCGHRDPERQFDLPRRIFFISRASSPSQHPPVRCRCQCRYSCR